VHSCFNGLPLCPPCADFCRWSLDLGVSTDIVGVVIATQTAVGDLKIAIGDNESPLSNAECSVGVQIEANATSAQVCCMASSLQKLSSSVKPTTNLVNYIAALSARHMCIGLQWQRPLSDPEPAERRCHKPVRGRGFPSCSQCSQQQAGVCFCRKWRLPGC
jgi:hypothetical protein